MSYTTKIFLCFLLLAGQLSAEAPPHTQWKKRVYLTSYPRSGNHWLRYLIEEATGLATSSVYFDPDPPHELAPWSAFTTRNGYEGTRRGPSYDEVVVIKTHYPALGITDYDLLEPYKAVRIVRHPVDAFASWHLSTRPQNPPEISEYRLAQYIHYWRLYEDFWNNNTDVYTIRYEDLYQNPFPVLKGVLSYMGFRVPDQNIHRAVTRYAPEGGLLKHLHRYTPEQLNRISLELGDLMKRYNYEIP